MSTSVVTEKEENEAIPIIVSGNVSSSAKFMVHEESDTESPGSKCSNFLRKGCNKKLLLKRLPILNWLPKYDREQAVSDLIAGLTVGLTVIPQGIAYAILAELPPQVKNIVI